MAPYHCWVCGWWHLSAHGHQPGRLERRYERRRAAAAEARVIERLPALRERFNARGSR